MAYIRKQINCSLFNNSKFRPTQVEVHVADSIPKDFTPDTKERKNTKRRIKFRKMNEKKETLIKHILIVIH